MFLVEVLELGICHRRVFSVFGWNLIESNLKLAVRTCVDQDLVRIVVSLSRNALVGLEVAFEVRLG